MVDLEKIKKLQEKKSFQRTFLRINFVCPQDLREKINSFQKKHKITNTSILLREILNDYFDKEEISNGK